MPTYIYHITHIRNLRSILKVGGLLASSHIQHENIRFRDISYRKLQRRRARIQVPCGVGGTLHDYVPFYFAPRSPMLYTINQGNVEGYLEGQNPILHLVTTAELVEIEGLVFTFTDGHAIMFPEFYDSLEDLSEIDWKIMKATYWADTLEDNDRSRRRQAEFLVYEFLPWSLISEIGVIDATIQQQVQQILRDLNQTTPVRVHRNWYY